MAYAIAILTHCTIIKAQNFEYICYIPIWAFCTLNHNGLVEKLFAPKTPQKYIIYKTSRCDYKHENVNKRATSIFLSSSQVIKLGLGVERMVCWAVPKVRGKLLSLSLFPSIRVVLFASNSQNDTGEYIYFYTVYRYISRTSRVWIFEKNIHLCIIYSFPLFCPYIPAPSHPPQQQQRFLYIGTYPKSVGCKKESRPRPRSTMSRTHTVLWYHVIKLKLGHFEKCDASFVTC